MALQLSMKPTGWFQIGWSGEIPPGGVKPMHYFGHDLVAFRSEDGELSVLDAYCRHLGAHLGYGGKVCKREIACPYHGWKWDVSGANTLIPGEERTIAKGLLRWNVIERHGIVFLWHDPAGGPPREGWELPDLFADIPELADRREADYYPCYPHAVVDKPNEPLHPQWVQENVCDTSHFKYTHGAALDPDLLWFKAEGTRFRASMGFKSPKTKEIVLRTYSLNSSIGLSFFAFDEHIHYRLVLSATPIDEERSHFRVSYYFPREQAGADALPQKWRDFAAGTEELFEEDARMWRHQRFAHRPIYMKRDVAGYKAMRDWCAQFYEAPAHLSPAMARMRDGEL